MSDTYQAIANSPMGKAVFSAINLPIPVILERWQPGQKSFISGGVLVGAAPGSSAVDTVFATLKGAPEAKPAVLANTRNANDLQKQAAAAGLNTDNYTATREDDSKFKALVFDATG
ncbi:MAG TPA: short chain dehydrogenase, partial [Alcanivorax sp.]|nr:short chain dehydrogenase [Alcanivorax sp.]